jgi:hypothetical protein
LNSVLEENYTYDAFISYRHLPHDKAIAEKLQKLAEMNLEVTLQFALLVVLKQRFLSNLKQIDQSIVENVSKNKETTLNNRYLKIPLRRDFFMI